MSMAYGVRLPLAPSGGFDYALAVSEWDKRGDGKVDRRLWRVEAVSYSTVIDADGELYGSTGPALELFVVSVKVWTPHGARMYGGRWIDLREGRNQWASRSPEEALEQFRWRRERQIYILEKQLRRAKAELALCEPSKRSPQA